MKNFTLFGFYFVGLIIDENTFIAESLYYIMLILVVFKGFFTSRGMGKSIVIFQESL